MEPKAFDLSELIERFKTKGLPVTEELAKLIVSETLGWIEASVVMSPSKYDDLVAMLIQGVRPFVMKELDKIDGKEG